ncbi:MAG TPA: GGDEF domain-containing protein, partial [Lacipirellulaceae bacterium]|nr:GGDEF domain-containing protein [Lacipirellulaceae bacterium]
MQRLAESPATIMVGDVILLILGGCLLGAIQLVVGVGIGLWARRPESASRGGNNDMQQAVAIAKRLQTLANEMSSIVGAHCNELEQASRLLTVDGASADETIADLVGNVVGSILHCNQSLQSKLDTAECRLQEQAVEIEAHICRSLTDPLTGLPNRREFNERLEERMGAWNRRREVFSLLMLDVDHFKKLNDIYGHLAGDQVLAAVAGVMRVAIRREDAIARYGGEEFAILLPNTSLEQAALVAHKVREAAGRTVLNHNEHAITITVSGGLATIQPNEPVESLIQRADAALYAAKAAGRNCSFAHNGVECVLADGAVAVASRGASNQLVELINSQDAEKPVTHNGQNETADFGSYL